MRRLLTGVGLLLCGGLVLLVPILAFAQTGPDAAVLAPQLIQLLGSILPAWALEVLQIVSLVVMLASAFVAMTPTPNPDTVWGKIYKVIEVAGLVIWRAKHLAPSSQGTLGITPLRVVLPVLLLIGLAGGLSACSSMRPAAPPPGTPQAKYQALCDEFWAGERAIGPLIAVAASLDPIAARGHQVAEIMLRTGCARDERGAYKVQDPADLARWLPQAAGAAGQLATLFIER